MAQRDVESVEESLPAPSKHDDGCERVHQHSAARSDGDTRLTPRGMEVPFDRGRSMGSREAACETVRVSDADHEAELPSEEFAEDVGAELSQVSAECGVFESGAESELRSSQVMDDAPSSESPSGRVSPTSVAELPAFSSNRLMKEAADVVATAAFPVTNVHAPTAAVPLEQPTAPTCRPSSIQEMFEAGWYERIVDFLRKSEAYERRGRRSKGGVRRPDDVRIPPEALKECFRGHVWFFADYLASNGRRPIITMEEAILTTPTLDADAAKLFGGIYGDESVTDRLVNGHRDHSTAARETILSVNHKGALQCWESVEAAFVAESKDDSAWLRGPFQFLPCFPCRVEPCGAVQQGAKVRITTDKSWPRDPVEGVVSVNSGIDLAALGVARFAKVLDFTKAVAILQQAEPDGEASNSDDDDSHVYEWKVDLTAAYRQIHVHWSSCWNRAKSWLGKAYLDVRCQFGDAAMVKAFQDVTDMVVFIARAACRGDAAVREACDFLSDADWAALDARPENVARWADLRRRSGLSGDDLQPQYLMGYIDDFLGAAVGRAAASAHCRLVRGILVKLGFPLNPTKTVWPCRRMEALGADVDVDAGAATLASSKAEKYAFLVADALLRKSLPCDELQSLVAKLVYAAQFMPVGRSWLTCAFTALTQTIRHKRRRAFVGVGLRRELTWWLEALPMSPGVTFYPKQRFAPAETAEYFFDASTSWGAGGAMVDADGTCFYWQQKWPDAMEEPLHINVGEAYAGLTSLRLFSTVTSRQCFTEHGDNLVANASARRGATPNRRIAEVLRDRGLFCASRGLATHQKYVNTLLNKMADPLSRGDDAKCMGAFEEAARARGAVRFVRLSPGVESLSLFDRVAAISHDGASEPELVPESGVATESVEHAESETSGVDGSPTPSPDTLFAPFGIISGFAGIDSPAMAAEQLGGRVVAAFDVDETIQLLHDRWHGRRCWGDFGAVDAFMRSGAMADYIAATLVYTAGTPCPDWSDAGEQRGPDGHSGGDLWERNVDFAVTAGFPVIILEQVPGILSVAGGRFLHAAVERLQQAGYLVQWDILRCNHHGDGTSRRRIFLAAVRRTYLKKDVTTLLPAGAGLQPEARCNLDSIADEEWHRSLEFGGTVDWKHRDVGDGEYDGPVLIGTIDGGGIGRQVYCSSGPVITQKTIGEGPGMTTGLYLFADGTVRRLSTTEACRSHSFPTPLIRFLQSEEFHESSIYRIVGNSIPVNTMKAVLTAVLSAVDPAQVPNPIVR